MGQWLHEQEYTIFQQFAEPTRRHQTGFAIRKAPFLQNFQNHFFLDQAKTARNGADRHIQIKHIVVFTGDVPSVLKIILELPIQDYVQEAQPGGNQSKHEDKNIHELNFLVTVFSEPAVFEFLGILLVLLNGFQEDADRVDSLKS